MPKLLKKKIFTKKVSKKRFRKTILRVKKLFSTTFYYHSKKLILINNYSNWVKLKAVIRITANNIFCTILQKDKNKIVYVGSIGKYKLKTSQRKMKFALKTVIKIFYDKIIELLDETNNTVFIEAIVPLKVKKIIIKSLSIFKKKKKNIIINIKPKKCFNGCVPPKKIRKRKRKMRILK